MYNKLIKHEINGLLKMRMFNIENTQISIIIISLCFLLIPGCGSTRESTTESTTMPVILDGRMLYTDTTIVDDQMVNIKLDPGPDTLRVGSGYFNIGVLKIGEYSLFLMPQKRKFDLPPSSLVLYDGLNIYDFIIPRHEEGDVAREGVSEDTVGVVHGRGRIR